MAKEYIEREALEIELNHRLSFLMAENGEYDAYTSGFDECVDRVENFQSAFDVAPVVHGQWKYYHKQGKAVCTNCSFERSVDDNFGRAVACPNCGAKMDGERKEGAYNG